MDTYCMMHKIILVQVKRHDLLLGVVTLQLDCHHPLYRFLESTLNRTPGRMLRIKLLGQLLCKGTASTGAALTQYDTFHDCSHQCLEVNAGVFLETDILSCHESLDQIR